MKQATAPATEPQKTAKERYLEYIASFFEDIDDQTAYAVYVFARVVWRKAYHAQKKEASV